MLESLHTKGFQVDFLSHAKAILSVDFPIALAELEAALSASTIPIEEIIAGGGGESKGTQRLRKALAAMGGPRPHLLLRSVSMANGEKASRTRLITCAPLKMEAVLPSK